MRLELGAVDEEVRLGDGLGREDVVAQAPLVRERDLDLRLLLEAVVLDAADALDHRGRSPTSSKRRRVSGW